MTFAEWHKFNFVDNKIMNIGDIYIKLFTKNSIKSDDVALCSLVKIEHAVAIFGNFNIIKITFNNGSGNTGNEYKTLCVLIYPNDN